MYMQYVHACIKSRGEVLPPRITPHTPGQKGRHECVCVRVCLYACMDECLRELRSPGEGGGGEGIPFPSTCIQIYPISIQ